MEEFGVFMTRVNSDCQSSLESRVYNVRDKIEDYCGRFFYDANVDVESDDESNYLSGYYNSARIEYSVYLAVTWI